MPKDTGNSKRVEQTLCRMCDDRCGLNIYLENGKIVDIDGYKPHPWNRGRICAKGRAALDMVYAPDRIFKPLKKTDDGWQEIELEDALDEIAEKMTKIKDKYGERSLGIWKGEAIGFAQQEELARRFCHAFGTPNYLSNDSTCFVGRFLGFKLVQGGLPAPDYSNAKCIVLWGANPPHAHPNMSRMIMEAKRNGGKLIVIDPRLSTIGRRADIYAQLKPGTDGALALGLIKILIENGTYDKEFVNNHTVGFDKLARYASSFTPEYVEKETGVYREVLFDIASTIARERPGVVNYVGNGPEHHENGVNNVRAVASIDALCGSVDRKGGNLLPEELNVSKLDLYDEIPLDHLEPIGAEQFPVAYDLRKECNTMMAMDTILTNEPYPLRSMIITAANPAMTNPNSKKVKEALHNLDLLVVRDLFMTQTARLADYVLPAASFLERNELFVHKLYQTVGLTKKIFSYPQCQDEYEFWRDMAKRLGIGSYFPWENEMELNKWLLEPTGITLDDLEAHPEGYQYKPMSYCKWRDKPLNTPSGKLEFASKYLSEKGFPELPDYKSPRYISEYSEQYPYVMITGARKMIYYHSRNRNFPRFRTAIPYPEVELHPEDAQYLGVEEGDAVKITSEIGSLDIPVHIMDEREIIPGFVQITHGWDEANVNLITPDLINDPLSGFPLLKGVPVKLEKVRNSEKG